MTRSMRRYVLVLGLAAAGWLCNGQIGHGSNVGLIASGVGGTASGIGVLPGAGAGQAGVGFSGGMLGVNFRV